MEAAAGADDELMEKFFEEGELSFDEMMHGLRKGILDGTVVPVVCCSGTTRVGLAKLLDNIIDLMPSPAGTVLEGVNPKTGETVERVCADDQPFSARVFKTMADPFVGKLSLMKITSGVLTRRRHAVQRQRGKDRKARHHLLPEGQEAEHHHARSARAICARWPSCRPSPPATPCATPATP